MSYAMSRGEVYWLKTKYEAEGAEMQKTRPCVVVSNNKGNVNSGIVTVALMTSKPKSSLPTHAVIGKTTKGYCEGSTILCEQLRTISQTRIDTDVDYLGRISDEDMDKLDGALAEALAPRHVESDYEEEYGVESDQCYDDELAKVVMERDFYKDKYESLMERIMDKALV